MKERFFIFAAWPAAVFLVLSVPAAAGPRPPENGEIKSTGSPAAVPGSMYTSDYLKLKEKIVERLIYSGKDEFAVSAGSAASGAEAFGAPEPEAAPGRKTIALTFDACGAKRGYNSRLIGFLKKEKIPATLFVSGVWIEKNEAVFRKLALDPLFEIENHGLLHRLCSFREWKLRGVRSIKTMGDIVDEIELNARRIEKFTARRPIFYRPAAAYLDDICARAARELGMTEIGYDVLSEDASSGVSAGTMRDNIVRKARDRAVVIMHFNHPEWREEAALKEAVPALRAEGFTFVKLQDLRPAAAGPDK